MEFPAIDPVYIVCGILFIVILALDMRDKRYRNKEDFMGGSWGKEPISNINFGKHNNYGNFGTDGFYPPKMRCYDQQLDFNCSNYVYNWNDKNMNVCKNQKNSNGAYLPDSKYIPTYVLGRSVGKPRQCRKLI
jgi:hypothetical protein